jgi:hypothetical protein
VKLERHHFICRFRWKGTDTWVVWYQDNRDGFVRHRNGRLLAASSERELAVEVAAMDLAIIPEEVADYDFDRLREWCRQPTAVLEQQSSERDTARRAFRPVLD